MSTTLDLTVYPGASREVLLTITKDGAPYVLLGATITARIFDASGSVIRTYTVGDGITVRNANQGLATLRVDGDDLPEVGAYRYSVEVLASGADDPDTVLVGALAVVDVLDPHVSEIRSHIGITVPPSDAALTAAYARLGSVEAVAAEILRQRRAELLANPLKFSLDGDYSEDRTENVKALERLIDSLDAAVVTPTEAASTSVSVVTMVRPDLSRRPYRSR